MNPGHQIGKLIPQARKVFPFRENRDMNEDTQDHKNWEGALALIWNETEKQ